MITTKYITIYGAASSADSGYFDTGPLTLDHGA